MGLSQAQIAKRLNLPVNTVSRWERGETSPDANSLAAIYSIATGAGIEPVFFRKGGDMVASTKRRNGQQKPLGGRWVLNQHRTRLGMMWDFQNVALDADEAYDTWFYMDKFLDIAFPKVTDWDLTAYYSGEQSAAVNDLRDFGFSGRLVLGDADRQIKEDIRRFCKLPSSLLWIDPVRSGLTHGDDASDTVLILTSKDGDFSDLLVEAKEAGIDVYLWTLPDCSGDLLRAVKGDHVIPWDHPRIIVSKENLKQLNR